VIRLGVACALAAACAHHYYPPPEVPRTCSEPQTRESLSCLQFDFELRLSSDGDLMHPADQGLVHASSRTECGCIQNLAAAVDIAAHEEVRSELIEGCRCIHER
jgi:hypothetical protein